MSDFRQNFYDTFTSACQALSLASLGMEEPCPTDFGESMHTPQEPVLHKETKSMKKLSIHYLSLLTLLLIATQSAHGAAIHDAAAEGDTQRVIELIESGFPVNTLSNPYFEIPLHYAARGGHTQTVEALLERGSLVDTDSTYTPLHYAVRGGHTQTVEALLRGGVEVDSLDVYRKIPLHVLVYQCPDDDREDEDLRANAIRALLDVGANPTIPNAQNLRPADIARQMNLEQLAPLLEDACRDSTLPYNRNAFVAFCRQTRHAKQNKSGETATYHTIGKIRVPKEIIGHEIGSFFIPDSDERRDLLAEFDRLMKPAAPCCTEETATAGSTDKRERYDDESDAFRTKRKREN